MKRSSTNFLPFLALVLAACAGANTNSPPASTPTTTSATTSITEKEPEPKAAVAESTPAPEPQPVARPAEATPEKCDGGWVCVKVTFEKKKVDKRDTLLIGDPKIEQTWSKMSDGRTVTFDSFSKGAVQLTLRRKPNNKNEVVVKMPKGSEIVIDRRDGTVEDFTHVGAIATEQDGELLVDLRYMR